MMTILVSELFTWVGNELFARMGTGGGNGERVTGIDVAKSVSAGVRDDANAGSAGSSSLPSLRTVIFLFGCLLFLASIIEMSTALLFDTSSSSTAMTLSPIRSLPLMGLSSLMELTNAVPPSWGISTTMPSLPAGALMSTFVLESSLELELLSSSAKLCNARGGGAIRIGPARGGALLAKLLAPVARSSSSPASPALRTVISLAGLFRFAASSLVTSRAGISRTSTPSTATILSPT
mmetsp:Transcript_58594/g.124349  ORF Transcript_58594/g.124349 Transcript_58594/m.124349 type:complete len:236 (+) Transcript_58594:1281-1988(+)